jgi:hypothetical protein
MKANRVPSGEYIGRDSVAGCDTSKCAAPPVNGTTQISPPETKAISDRSGEMEGSANAGFDCRTTGRLCAASVVVRSGMKRNRERRIGTPVGGRK